MDGMVGGGRYGWYGGRRKVWTVWWEEKGIDGMDGRRKVWIVGGRYGWYGGRKV